MIVGIRDMGLFCGIKITTQCHVLDDTILKHIPHFLWSAMPKNAFENNAKLGSDAESVILAPIVHHGQLLE